MIRGEYRVEFKSFKNVITFSSLDKKSSTRPSFVIAWLTLLVTHTLVAIVSVSTFTRVAYIAHLVWRTRGQFKRVLVNRSVDS